MSDLNGVAKLALAAALLAGTTLLGCGNEAGGVFGTPTTGPGAVKVPHPLEVLLPKAVRIHPFTGTRVFSEAGGITGIDLRIEAIDGYGDASKAFGRFRFELFRHQPNNPDEKGARVALWNVAVEDVKDNRSHWNSITRTYQFKLGWGESIPIGSKFVLLAVFESRFTPRMFDQRVFVAGQ